MNDNVILIPHVEVQNANALSSPFTIGFPAMTAWLGAAHALERKLNSQRSENPVCFTGVGVVSHHFHLHTHKGPGDYVFSIVGTGNPLEPKSEKGKPKGNAVRPSFIEEARCRLEVSIVLQFEGIEAYEEPQVLEQINHHMHASMKIAGGDILNFDCPEVVRDFKTLKRKLMPGYAIVERRDLMQQAMEEGQDAIDALLDYLAIHHTCTKEVKNGEEQVIWQSKRKPTNAEGKTGWIVPIATGFHGISDIGAALNQRDTKTPHRFAESVVTLGEFIMPYRMASLSELLWHYHYDEKSALYLCQQKKALQPEEPEYDY